MKRLLMILLACVVSITAMAENKWELQKDVDGIKVYTCSVPNSDIKAIKVSCMLDATMSQLTALLLDVKAHEQWVYKNKKSYLVKQIAPNHLIYYSEVEMPWPMANRYVVIDLTITQQPVTKVMYIAAGSVDQEVENVKGKVRVTWSKVNWTVTPAANGKLSVEYVAEADPGASVPAWLSNPFSTRGPFETFKQLKVLVDAPTYQHAQYDFIKD